MLTRSAVRLALPLLVLSLLGSSLPDPAQGADYLLSKSEERKVGEEVLKDVRKEFRVLDDPYLTQYLDRMGDRLARAMGQTQFDMDFHVVADLQINAFAVPGGHIFVTSQTVLLCRDESELAGVIAHEMGHAQARHLAHRLEKSTPLNLAALAAILAGAFLGSPQVGAALSSFTMAGVQTKMLQYSQQDEEDADRRAARALVASGYDGWGMVRFMETVQRESPAPEGIPTYLFTHPLPANRASYLADALQGPPKAPPTPAQLGPLWRAQARVLVLDPRNWGLSTFEKRVREYPDSADARLGLALLVREQGRYEEALSYLEKAAALDPGDPEILAEEANTMIREGRANEGIGILETLRSEGKAGVPALRDLGWAYLEADKGEKALAVYDELAKLEPRWDQLSYYRGMALGKAGKAGEAHEALGDYYRGLGRKDLAERHYREALRLLPPGEAREQVQQALESLKGEGRGGDSSG